MARPVDGISAFVAPADVCVFFAFLATAKQIGLIFREHVDLFLGFQILNCRFTVKQVHELVVSFQFGLEGL